MIEKNEFKSFSALILWGSVFRVPSIAVFRLNDVTPLTVSHQPLVAEMGSVRRRNIDQESS